jgi:hypothetical protein
VERPGVDLADEFERRRIGAEIADGYRRAPTAGDERSRLDEATESMMIAEEPW